MKHQHPRCCNYVRKQVIKGMLSIAQSEFQIHDSTILNNSLKSLSMQLGEWECPFLWSEKPDSRKEEKARACDIPLKVDRFKTSGSL